MEYIIYFVVFVIIVLWGISVYLLQTGKLKAKEWLTHTLGLPTASVRALIAFIIIFLVFCPAMTKQSLPELPSWLVGILGTIIGFYFGASTATGAATAARRGDNGNDTRTDDTDDSADRLAKKK
jgi:ABC-type methionine transport system permease subunit